MKHKHCKVWSTFALKILPLAIVPLTSASCASGSSIADGDAPDSLGTASPIAPDRSAALSDSRRAALLMQRHMERIAASPVGTVAGQVTGIDGTPLSGITVRIASEETKTDASGDYELTGIPIGNHVVTFTHPSYVLTQHAVSVQPGDEPWVAGQMLPRSAAHHFDVDVGARIEDGPLTLEFEPKDLVFADGQPVHGQVDVVVTAIDPRKEGHVLAAPARLEGITVEGQQVGLFSYGMLEVEISQGSRKVQVHPGETVKTSLNVGHDFALEPGAVIPMWHHDADLGIWVQERGTSAKVGMVGGKMVAVTELPHFSAWNFDAVTGTVCAAIRVPATTPISNFRVASTDVGGNIDNVWFFNSQCAPDSRRGSVCITDVPSGYMAGVYGGAVSFKFQVQASGSSAWTDLTINLNGAAQTVFLGSQIQTWLTNNALSGGSWCGSSTPVPGSGVYLNGTYQLGNFPATLPTKTVRMGVATTGVAGLGANNLSGGDDTYFMTMRNNGLNGSALINDYDHDGVPDRLDNCVARSNPNQADTNGNGIGDVCEAWCYVPAGGNASWYDADGDGIDDLCDDKISTYNPSQYMP